MNGNPIVGAVHLTERAQQLDHFWEECVGSGHAALALRADWQAQLARCHAELGMRRVRFHGLLSDDVGTHVSYGGRTIDSFHNADRIMDFLAGLGMSPCIEWSFMPTVLASGQATVFSYKGNITPPKDFGTWADLVGRLTGHWLRRYGSQELRRWQFEVWNEPNLPAFWTGNQHDYFELYRRTATAIKQVDHRLAVGGPATAKNAWLADFIAFCQTRSVPLDFVSTHHYPTDAFGNASADISDQLARSARSELRTQAERARAQVGGLPLFYTEWSMTSSPSDAMHDQPISAAYIIHTVLGMRGVVDGYSYWTFSDIFAENFFPSRPFHGGFGLLNLHGIPKPAYHAFAMLHGLGTEIWPVPIQHPTCEAWITRKGRTLTIVAINFALPRHPGSSVELALTIADCQRPEACTIDRIDEDHVNPRRIWQEMGEPDYLSKDQVAAILSASAPRPATHPWQFRHDAVTVNLVLPLNGTATITLEFSARAQPTDLITGISANYTHADDAFIDQAQYDAFSFFLTKCQPDTGLIADTTQPQSFASIGSIGFALASYPVAVERGWMTRAQAAQRARQVLTFLRDAPQGLQPDSSGYEGYFYHFLDMKTGIRAGDCELSTIDTALLVSGALLAANYFDDGSLAEWDLRHAAAQLYQRVNWSWALNGGHLLAKGWRPGLGFIGGLWDDYSEALLLYILASGSPSQALPTACYEAYQSHFSWKTVLDIPYLHAGPLFIHQYPMCFLDLRGIRDRFMREHACDYAENGRRATLVQQRYAMLNPKGFRGYGEHCWGITASNGPTGDKAMVDGIERTFLGYCARGVPDGPDDGTLSPAATLASLPFAPELIMPTVSQMLGMIPHPHARHGFAPSFNLSYPKDGGWSTSWHSGINQGPVVAMIENHRSGLLWKLMRSQADLCRGLRRCGFTGGYLD